MAIEQYKNIVNVIKVLFVTIIITIILGGEIGSCKWFWEHLICV